MKLNKFEVALEKGAFCQRLSKEEAYTLIESITPDVFHKLGRAALRNRRLRYGDIATYVSNLHVNPSNICIAGCKFCNYAASAREKHAYVMSEKEIFNKIDKFSPTEVHIVGGLNEIWSYSRNLKLIGSLRQRYPELYIKAFTAVEIEYFAKTLNCFEDVVLDELKSAGMDAMTGGGAEIFSNRLYRKHWKNKTKPCDWIRIHKHAHKKGIPTNATMLFGFGDTWTERVKHLLILRDVQEKSGGFLSFIPLPFQPGKSNFNSKKLMPLETLIVLALSRLILNNIPHLKSYWPMMGIGASVAGLSWGADDLDGTIKEEKIAHFAGASTPIGMLIDSMIDMIKIGGFTPKERTGNFDSK